MDRLVSRAMRVLLGAGILGLLQASVLAAPTIEGLTLEPNPNEAVPLAAIGALKTNVPTRIIVRVSDGIEVIEGSPSTAFRTEHTFPVLGLRPDSENAVTIVAEDENGDRTESDPHTIKTDPLPDNFPKFDVRMSRPRKMEPGFTFIPFLRWPGPQPDREFGLVVAVDAHGRVVWYYHTDQTFGDAYRLQNGHFVSQLDRDGRLVEFDMLGNTIREWHTTNIPKDVSADSIPVEADTFHHDQVELPSGNLLMLTTEVRTFEDYYSSETDPDAPRKPAQVIGDVILEMTREGDIVRKWHLFDIFDPYRIGYGSLGTGFYAESYKDVLEKPAMDWSHTNSVFYDPTDNSMILSSYHLDVVYKIDMESGELVWLLGNHKAWKEPWQKYLLEPVGEDFRWHYHQHAAKVTPHGTVLMFDNGTGQATPFDERKPVEEVWSRAVEYKIDEEAMTVEQVWSYGGPDDEIFFSAFISDADWLPERGNVLITDGGRMRNAKGEDTSNFLGAHHWARVLEVTHEDPAEKVWEIVIDDPEVGWAVYRSQRMPLYPPNGVAITGSD